MLSALRVILWWCRDILPNTKNLAIFCGSLAVQSLNLPWREDVFVLKCLVKNRAIESVVKSLTQLGRGGPSLKTNMTKKANNCDSNELIWISCSRITENLKYSQSLFESEDILEVLHELHHVHRAIDVIDEHWNSRAFQDCQNSLYISRGGFEKDFHWSRAPCCPRLELNIRDDLTFNHEQHDKHEQYMYNVTCKTSIVNVFSLRG